MSNTSPAVRTVLVKGSHSPFKKTLNVKFLEKLDIPFQTVLFLLLPLGRGREAKQIRRLKGTYCTSSLVHSRSSSNDVLHHAVCYVCCKFSAKNFVKIAQKKGLKLNIFCL